MPKDMDQEIDRPVGYRSPGLTFRTSPVLAAPISRSQQSSRSNLVADTAYSTTLTRGWVKMLSEVVCM